jgi:sugar fermentation stimulation protein A
MFPDAVTKRGQRHLTELAALARAGMPGGVVFLVHSSQVKFFLPDYHTDPDFARILFESKKDIFIKAVAAGWRRDMTLDTGNIRELTIPWDLLQQEAKDRGAYILLMELSRDRKIGVGSLGTVSFRKGYYLYAASAEEILGLRPAQHRGKEKPPRKHVDSLRAEADSCMTIPIVSGGALEHQLAEALLTIGTWSIPRFGSNCSCATHLVGMRENPFQCRRFIELLSYFRIDRLEEELR